GEAGGGGGARGGRPGPQGRGKKPRSSAPAREAAVCNTPNPFQPSAIAPAASAALAASERTAAPSLRAKAPWPISQIGRLRSLAVLTVASVSGPAPRYS